MKCMDEMQRAKPDNNRKKDVLQNFQSSNIDSYLASPRNHSKQLYIHKFTNDNTNNFSRKTNLKTIPKNTPKATYYFQ